MTGPKPGTITSPTTKPFGNNGGFAGNVIEASFINLPSRRVSYMNLPGQFENMLRKRKKLPWAERRRIVAALIETNWNKSKAARTLKWSRMTLYRKMAKYNIDPNRRPPDYPPTFDPAAILDQGS